MQPGTDTEITQKSAESKQTGRNRRYSSAFKRKVVKESLVPGASVSVVARRHDINSNIVFRWRKEFREAERDRAAQSKKGLTHSRATEKRSPKIACMPRQGGEEKANMVAYD
jgi:transposase-like protein